MALEAVVFLQDPLIISTPSFNCSYHTSINDNNNIANYYYSTSKLEDSIKSSYNNVGLFEVNNNNSSSNNNNNNNYLSNLFCDYSPNSELINLDESISNSVPQWSDHHYQYAHLHFSSPEDNPSSEAPPPKATTIPAVTEGGGRRKRRRQSCKNKEEVELQRMTHIAVERNRRKQMNEYLAIIRSLMPSSYVQRGDQASIVGGAINYVKELEQLLQSMEGQKKQHRHDCHHETPPSPSGDGGGGGGSDEGVVTQESNSSCLETKARAPLLFADFFSFPQYSTRSYPNSEEGLGSNPVSRCNSGVGEIEVTMVESHANVKILAKKKRKQIVKLIAGFQGLRLNVLHLNVTTVDSFVLYSLSLKVEEGCQLNSVDDIASATNHILGQIQEEAEVYQ